MTEETLMTRREAVDRSDQKWQAIIDGKGSYGRCGFCEYIAEHHSRAGKFGDSNHLCKMYCPLYPDICSNHKSDALYHQWLHSWEEDLSLARQILEAVREQGEI